MATYVESVAAATAIVGYDLLDNAFWRQSPADRVLTGVALKGSTAAGDTEVELFIDTVKLSTLFNTGAGYPNNDDIVPLESLFVPGGSILHAYVTDAPVTNPIYLLLSDEEV